MSFLISSNIISSLGFTTNEVFKSLQNGKIGIEKIDNSHYYNQVFPASLIDANSLEDMFSALQKKYNSQAVYTKLEKMLILSIDDALSQSMIDIKSSKTAIILSTTKGNINLLEKEEKNNFETSRVLLWKLGDILTDFFGCPNKCIVISNACISGVLALNTAASYINGGQFDNIVVAGGDIISKFVVSGFMSFLSLSSEPCRPFDKNRDGLSLGEAAASIVLSKNNNSSGSSLKFMGGATANDANHISGPSRTAEGSYIAIAKAMHEAGIHADEIDHISAHGTATPYNDEMESIAMERHGLEKVEVNSLKGSIGHTLGAAGVIETAILMEEMKHNLMLKSAGFDESGVSRNINVLKSNIKKELKNCLKMASGFGGSNAALIVSKL